MIQFVQNHLDDMDLKKVRMHTAVMCLACVARCCVVLGCVLASGEVYAGRGTLWW